MGFATSIGKRRRIKGVHQRKTRINPQSLADEEEAPIMAWMRLIQSARSVLKTAPSSSTVNLPRFYSKPASYPVKIGIPEFLSGIGGGVETHIAKLETEIGDFSKLLVTRTLRLKKYGIPCKHRKLILKYSHKYRLGLWKPRADAIKA